MRIPYPILQAAGILSGVGLLMFGVVDLLKSPGDIAVAKPYSVAGMGASEWALKTRNMEAFGVQRDFSWSAYDFVRGCKIPIEQSGAFACDPFVNYAKGDIPYFISAEDVENEQKLRLWLESLAAEIGGLKLSGISSGMGCAFVSAQEGRDTSVSFWATSGKPLLFRVPDEMMALVQKQSPQSLRKGMICVPMTSLGEDSAEFLIPIIDRRIRLERAQTKDTDEIIYLPYAEKAENEDL